MEENKVYLFERPSSEELPPSFEAIMIYLTGKRIYGASIHHPEQNWNLIELQIAAGRKAPLKKIEEIFIEEGYSLRTEVNR